MCPTSKAALARAIRRTSYAPLSRTPTSLEVAVSPTALPTRLACIASALSTSRATARTFRSVCLSALTSPSFNGHQPPRCALSLPLVALRRKYFFWSYLICDASTNTFAVPSLLARPAPLLSRPLTCPLRLALSLRPSRLPWSRSLRSARVRFFRRVEGGIRRSKVCLVSCVYMGGFNLPTLKINWAPRSKSTGFFWVSTGLFT
jgi:hypothetical protein